MPILTYPGSSLFGYTVMETLSDSQKQSDVIRAVIKRTGAAAAFVFMDLSIEAECYGATIRFAEDEIPTVAEGILYDLEKEKIQSPPALSERARICVDAISKTAGTIGERPLFGNSIGPFSLAGRLADVTNIMMACYDFPDRVEELLNSVTDFIITYCLEFKKAGADGIILAEPLAGMLSPELASNFSSPFVKKIVDAVADDNFAVMYHNCGNNTLQMIDSIISTGASAFHFGNAVNIADICAKMPSDKLVLGNLDPVGVLKNGTPETVAAATVNLLDECSQFDNFVMSSGCDIPPGTPWENIDSFIKAIEYYKQ